MDFGAFNHAARQLSHALGGEVVPIPSDLEGPAAVLFPAFFLANTKLVTAAGLALAGGAGAIGAAGSGGSSAAEGSFLDHLESSVARQAEDAALQSILPRKRS